MNIVEFYKRLSKILEMRREGVYSESSAKFDLKELIYEAEKAKLSINISENILNMDNLVKYDDENSFTQDYEENESSYEDESSSFTQDYEDESSY